jgi:hypothetical protein
VQGVDGRDLVLEVMERARPDTVVTFGPRRPSPDHRCVGVDGGVASSPPACGTPRSPAFHDAWGQVNARLGIWTDQPSPPCTESADVAHAVSLTGALDQGWRRCRLTPRRPNR